MARTTSEAGRAYSSPLCKLRRRTSRSSPPERLPLQSGCEIKPARPVPKYICAWKRPPCAECRSLCAVCSARGSPRARRSGQTFPALHGCADLLSAYSVSRPKTSLRPLPRTGCCIPRPELWIEEMLTGQNALFHGAAPFHQHGADAAAQQTQGTEKSRRAASHHYDRRGCLATCGIFFSLWEARIFPPRPNTASGCPPCFSHPETCLKYGHICTRGLFERLFYTGAPPIPRV